MATFNVSIHLEAWWHLEVEADSFEEARDTAVSTMENEPVEPTVSLVSVEEEGGDLRIYNMA